MSSSDHQAYDDDLTALLAAVWGEGFLSPGGTEEVDRLLAGVELNSKAILDIGCGLGGMDVHICKSHTSAQVTGIDVDVSLIEKCKALAGKHALVENLSFQLVSPGPLPFEEGSFDVVTSKDSILHIVDKHALAADVFRVLKPGGIFAASDWLAGYRHEPSPEMQAYVDAEDLGFGMASAVTYRQAMDEAGFENIDFVDRNEWYRGVARAERERLTGSLYTQLSSAVGREFLDRQIEVWNLMIVALDQGQLCPTLLRGEKLLC
ncbi:MAG: SAM-dependent methyltransferase [Halieaceae bacterium]|jgi:SAM-dependent methyltransferase